MFGKKIIDGLYIRFFRLFYKSKFKQFGKKTNVLFPLNINGTKNISIGNNVNIGYKTWLAAISHTGNAICELKIGDGCQIGNFNHIYATHSIVIGNNVLFADKIYISDNLHSYEDINTPILKQSIRQINGVIIGDGAWIGENVCIIGSRIGKNSVIGANAVVTKDIPDYCVAVGNPAKVIKRYCFENNEWIKINY